MSTKNNNAEDSLYSVDLTYLLNDEDEYDDLDFEGSNNPSGEDYYSDNRQTFDIYEDLKLKEHNAPYSFPYDNIEESENNAMDNNSDLLEYLSEVGSVSYGANTGDSGINFKKEAKRVPKEITDKDDLKEILELTHDKAAQKTIVMDYFGDFGDGPRFQPYWTIKVPAGAYGGYSKINKEITTSKRTNKAPFTTTIGLWIFNKMFIEPMSDILGYINTTITAGVYGDINQKVSYALIEDKITVQQLKDFISQSQILMSCCSALSSSHTNTIFFMEEKIAKKKEELRKKYGDKLSRDNPDLDAASKYETELIDYAKEILKDDPAVDMFDSGARSKWGNNFKNMYLTRGPLRRTDGTFSFSDNSYIEGMDPKDYVAISDASIGGPFSRSRLTASGGYVEKQFTNATQHLKVLPKGSDCKTNHYIEVSLNKSNIKDWYYSYIIGTSGNLIELTPEVASKYIDKKVKMRFSSLCHSKTGICEACAGTMFRHIGITNIGMASMIMASSIKNANMKKFHDSSIKLVHLDANKLFN